MRTIFVFSVMSLPSGIKQRAAQIMSAPLHTQHTHTNWEFRLLRDDWWCWKIDSRANIINFMTVNNAPPPAQKPLQPHINWPLSMFSLGPAAATRRRRRRRRRHSPTNMSINGIDKKRRSYRYAFLTHRRTRSRTPQKVARIEIDRRLTTKTRRHDSSISAVRLSSIVSGQQGCTHVRLLFVQYSIIFPPDMNYDGAHMVRGWDEWFQFADWQTSQSVNSGDCKWLPHE